MVDILVNSLNAGQMDKKLRYRMDFDRRGKAVAELTNANVDIRGGVKRRAGTELLIEEPLKFMEPTTINDIGITTESISGHTYGDFAFKGSVDIGDNTLLLIPYFSDYFVTYDVDAETFSQGVVHGENAAPFSGGVVVDNKVILTPGQSNYIGIYDITTGVYTRGPEIPFWQEGGGAAYNGDGVLWNGAVWFAPWLNSKMISYNPITNQVTEHFDIGIESWDGNYAAIADCGGVLMLAPYASPYFSYVTTSGLVHLQDTILYETYYDLVVVGKEVVYVPYSADRITVYNFDINEFRTIDYPINEGSFLGGLAYDGKVVFTPYSATSIIAFNPVFDTFESIAPLADPSAGYVGRPIFTNDKIIYTPFNTDKMLISNPDVASPQDLDTELYMTVGLPRAGGTGSDHIITYTDKAIMAYDVDADVLVDINWLSTTGYTSGFITPPKPLDYVTLNDVILFTTENDVIYELIRKFDSNGKAYFEFGEWDINEPSTPLESNGFTTARVSVPIAYKPIVDADGNRWYADEYYYGVQPSNTFSGYATTYNNTNRIDRNEVGAFEMLVITSIKFDTIWTGSGDTLKLELVDPTDIYTEDGNKWFFVDEDTGLQVPYGTNIDTVGRGYVVIPTELDLNVTVAGSQADRYIGLIMQDTVSTGDLPVDIEDRGLPLHITEPNVDNIKVNFTELVKTIVKATEADQVLHTGTHLIKLLGTEMQTSDTIEVDDEVIYTKQDISELPAFDNSRVGWAYSSEDIRIRDVGFTTEYHEDWDSSVTIEDPITPGDPLIINLGMVLGDWEFRTAGNWTGSYEIQSKRAFEWTTEKIVTSAKDYNAIINDGYEGVYGVHYRLVISLVTAAGTQAVRAGYTFSWDNYNCFYLSEQDTNAKETFSTWYADEPNLLFESIVFHQNRLWLSYQSTIYASAVNDINQFGSYGIPTDASPIKYNLADTQTARINWLHVIGQDVVIGTQAGQWSLRSDSGVLNQSTIMAIRQTSISTSTVKPTNLGIEMIYVDKAQTRVYSATYDYQVEKLVSNEITVYADGMFTSGIRKVVYDDINKQLYIVINWDRTLENAVSPRDNDIYNNQLVTCNYDQNIIAHNGNVFAPHDTQETLWGTGGLDDIIVMSGKTYSIKSPRYVDADNNSGLRIVEMNPTIYGDYFVSDYYSKTISNSETFSPYDGKTCLYRSTMERAWTLGVMSTEVYGQYIDPNPFNGGDILLEERFRDEYWSFDFDADEGYYKGIEIMAPIDMQLTTFPIDWGVAGMEHTVGKKKNINEVTILADDTSGGWCSWSAGATKEYYADGIYEQQVDGYIPEAKEGQFDVAVVSQWNEDIVLTIHDSSPNPTVINGLIYKFGQGK